MPLSLTTILSSGTSFNRLNDMSRLMFKVFRSCYWCYYLAPYRGLYPVLSSYGLLRDIRAWVPLPDGTDRSTGLVQGGNDQKDRVSIVGPRLINLILIEYEIFPEQRLCGPFPCLVQIGKAASKKRFSVRPIWPQRPFYHNGNDLGKAESLRMRLWGDAFLSSAIRFTGCLLSFNGGLKTPYRIHVLYPCFKVGQWNVRFVLCSSSRLYLRIHVNAHGEIYRKDMVFKDYRKKKPQIDFYHMPI